MEPLTLSRPLSVLRLSLFAAATGGYGWTAFTSTHRGGFGLYRSVQLLLPLCACVRVSICVSVRLDWRVAIFSPRVTDEKRSSEKCRGVHVQIPAKEECLHPK